MKEKIRMAAEKISAPFRFIGNIMKKPFVAFYEKNEKEIGKTIQVMNKYSILLHAAWSLILEFFIESFSRHSIANGFEFLAGSPLVFLYNSLLIFMTLMITYLFRRRFVIRLGLSAIWIYGGYMNGTVLSNRVTPFTAQDIKLLEDLADILDKYMSPDKLLMNVLLVVGAIAILYFLWKKGPKFQGKMHYVRNTLGFLLVVGIFAGSTFLALENRVIS